MAQFSDIASHHPSTLCIDALLSSIPGPSLFYRYQPHDKSVSNEDPAFSAAANLTPPHIHCGRYLENGACVTMTDIYESRVDNTGNKGPVYPVDESTMQISDTVTGSWYLEADLYITEGSKLILKGESTAVRSTCG